MGVWPYFVSENPNLIVLVAIFGILRKGSGHLYKMAATGVAVITYSIY